MTTPTLPAVTGYAILQGQIAAAQDSADTIARAINDSPNYTEEGRQERFEKHTAEHRDYLAKVTERVDQIVSDAEQRYASARADLLPVPEDDTASAAAEMQAQRILARPGMTDGSAALAWLTESEPSPARTAVIEELQARGILRQDTIDRVLDSDPAAAAAAQARTAAQTVASAYLRPQLSALARRLDNRNAQGPSAMESLQVGKIDGLPPLEVRGLPGWTPTSAESAYRSR